IVIIKCNNFDIYAQLLYNSTYIDYLRRLYTMGAKWIKIGVLYFIIGIAIGLFMSATIDLRWGAAHAHVNVVGWLSTVLIGVVYSVYPKAGNSSLGKGAFWLYNIGLPFLLASMFMVQIASVRGIAHYFTFTAGAAVTLGVILFIITVYTHVHEDKAVTRQ